MEKDVLRKPYSVNSEEAVGQIFSRLADEHALLNDARPLLTRKAYRELAESVEMTERQALRLLYSQLASRET